MRYSILHALLCFTLSGCGAGWSRTDLASPAPLPPRKQVQVFHQGEMTRWHAVTVASDSLSGIPWLQPIECDSCRQSLPRMAVDSIRVGDPVLGPWKTLGLVVFGPPVLFSVICLIVGEGAACWVPPST